MTPGYFCSSDPLLVHVKLSVKFFGSGVPAGGRSGDSGNNYREYGELHF